MWTLFDVWRWLRWTALPAETFQRIMFAKRRWRALPAVALHLVMGAFFPDLGWHVSD